MLYHHLYHSQYQYERYLINHNGLDISEVKEYTPVEEPDFWERITTGFESSVRNTGMILEELLIFCVCAIPYLTPPTVVVAAIGLIVLLVVFIAKRKKSKSK